MEKHNQSLINFISESAKIGNNVKIWHFSYVGNNTEIGDNVSIGSLVHIDYNVRAVFKAGVSVGRNSVVAMGAVVTKDVPPDVVVMGHPATVRYSRDEYEAKKKSWNS